MVAGKVSVPAQGIQDLHYFNADISSAQHNFKVTLLYKIRMYRWKNKGTKKTEKTLTCTKARLFLLLVHIGLPDFFEGRQLFVMPFLHDSAVLQQNDSRIRPNDRFELSLTWWPYYVTGNQGDDVIGLKNEVGVQAIWALGDGDVNFALGDGLETIVDGVFVSLENRTGWESEGTYLGNYTDPWLGLGFNIDLLNITLSAGPRFYSPGSYSGLPFRTDWGGEIELEYPLAESVVVFAHWKPIYSSQGGDGWGVGWQHHIGTGVSFSFYSWKSFSESKLRDGT